MSYQEDVNDPSTRVEVPSKEDIYLEEENVLSDAVKQTKTEHDMTPWEGLKAYPMACFWAFWFSTSLIMEGFDHAFVSGFFAFPAFQRRFGKLTADGSYQIPANIQAGIGNGVSAGEIIGLLIYGYVCDYTGYRWCMIGCLFFMMCFIFLQFFAKSIYMYLGAEILLGLPWGVFQTLSTTYAAEVCPVVLRPYLTMLVSFCWSVGYLAGSGTLRGFLQVDGQWAYRIPFALQWIWPIPLAIGIYLAPESPWWLVRRGRPDDAATSLRRLKQRATDEEIENQVAMIIHTDRVEKEMQSKSTYWQLFQGVNLRRTEITVIAYLGQNLASPLVAYIVYFLEQAGLSSTYSFDFGIGEYCLAILGVFVAWSIVNKVGRRDLYLCGMLFMAVTTYIIAFMGIPKMTTSIAYGIGSILLIEYFVFFITIGPICYTIVSDVPSNYLRTKSIALARAIYNIWGLVTGQLVPRFIQRAAWNVGAKTGFYCGSLMFLQLIWCFFRLPETKDRTFAEIDILFKDRIPARKFSKMGVNLRTESTYLKSDGPPDEEGHEAEEGEDNTFEAADKV